MLGRFVLALADRTREADEMVLRTIPQATRYAR